jgi:hypothetical protein
MVSTVSSGMILMVVHELAVTMRPSPVRMTVTQARQLKIAKGQQGHKQ